VVVAGIRRNLRRGARHHVQHPRRQEYQPIVSIETGEIVGCEALVRCQHPSQPTDKLGACIPRWYRIGMSTQIAVRLSDDMVAFIDDLVSRGEGSSRAAVVSRALERERRRKIAERDADILAGEVSDADLDQLAEIAAATPMPDLD
jgi:Arc/MetJ-type ribon-helix-helix transcriptional regulator